MKVNEVHEEREKERKIERNEPKSHEKIIEDKNIKEFENNKKMIKIYIKL